MIKLISGVDNIMADN